MKCSWLRHDNLFGARVTDMCCAILAGEASARPVHSWHVSHRFWFLACLLTLLLAGCGGERTPSPTPTLEPASPTATQQAILEPLTPVPTETPTPPPTLPSDSGTLVLWHSWSGADADALARILGAFQVAHPAIEVETLFVAYNRLAQAYADAVYAGGGPDLILTPSWWLQELADAGVLLPLDDQVDPALLESFLPAAVENVSYAGQVYGLPTNFDLVSLYYNRNLIDPDQLPETTEEMLALAQEDPSQGAGLYANFYHLYWGIPAYGSTLFDDEGRVVLDQTPGTAGFLTWLAEMKNTPGVFVELDYGMLIDRFKKEEFAFFLDGPWSIEELRQSLGDALDVTMLPAGPAGPAQPWLSADGVFLNPVMAPEQQQLALLLAQHLTSAESGTTLAQVTHRIPARIDAQAGDPLLQKFVQQATTSVPEPHRPEMAQVWGYAGDMLSKALNGVMSPAEAVIEATTLINEANDK